MMKRVMFLILSLAVLIGMGLATSAATAGDGVYGDMRWRWEGFKNFEDLNSDQDDSWAAHYLRSRLGYKGMLGEDAFYKMSIENMRVMGGDYPSPFAGDLYGFGPVKALDGYLMPWPYSVARPLGTTNAGMFVHEAYFGVKDFLFDDFSLKFGRFALNYGRERIIGSNDWSNHTRNRFDGAIGQYSFETGWIDFLWLKLAESGPEFWNLDFMGDYGDVTMRGAYAHVDATETFFLEPHLLWLNANNKQADPDAVDEELDDANIYGFGALLDFMSDFGLHAYGEAEFQSGSYMQGTTKVDISATGFYAGAFYTFESDVDPYLGVEFNFASGQEADNPDLKVFLNPFGSHSEYMGRMNIVDWGLPLNSIDGIEYLGTSTFRFAGGISPTEDFDLSADFFLIRTDEDYTFTNENGVDDTSNKIGTELDVQADYYYNEYLSFEGGLGIFSLDNDYFDGQDTDSIVYTWLGSRISF